ncbi:hypothetical protein GCM10014715_57910 [Streptomyces spiralis]|uniref:Uncharacterized protein n=1 Tax=Streptomyces spiralis TaxID=66376 RepID=A0A919DZ85_9ACTN|nr:hypothetical protein GCM10014715_57910 [Streptomyces spiralis]
MFAAPAPDHFGEDYDATDYGLVYSGKPVSGLFGGGLGSMGVGARGYNGALCAPTGGVSMGAAAIALLLRRTGRGGRDGAPVPAAAGPRTSAG